ncbi:choice-of-anchor D domain-containing protein [Nonomuraea sp. NPDC050556]|uniref:choice-of-anchor D domain-containing protein n=1 Tax=Nonomuraea sp. NPDC050556 TaxID=3364369 RepID=UPI00379A6D38
MAYTWAPWSRTDTPGLARRILPEAGRYLRLDLPLPRDATPKERREALDAVLGAVRAERLRFDAVPVDTALVQVRSPGEVMDGHATPLDVAALLCGACAGAGLLAVLAVAVRGAPVVLVGLTRGIGEWAAVPLFAEGVSRDEAAIRALSGAYAVVDPLDLLSGVPARRVTDPPECFPVERPDAPRGPAGSDPSTPQGPDGSAGRVGDRRGHPRGVPGWRVGDFRGARERTDGFPAGFELLFAVDVATEWCARGVEPLRLSGHDDIVVANGQAVSLTDPIPKPAVPLVRPLARPVRATFPRDRAFVGRTRELAVLRAALAPGAVVTLAGPPGSGRTAVLRELAHNASGEDFPDGVVCLDGSGDLLFDLFQVFYATDRPYRPSPHELAWYLAGLRALVLVDDAELPRAHQDRLLHDLPGLALVLATTVPDTGGIVVTLPPLGAHDAAELFAARLGRRLDDRENAAAAAAWRDVGGHPAALAAAAEHLRAGEPGSGPRHVATVFHRLPPPQRDVLALLAALEVPVAADHLSAALGTACHEALWALMERGLVDGGPLRFRATPYVCAALAPEINARVWHERMLGHLAVWIELNAGDRDRVLADQALLVRMAVWSDRAGYGERAVALLRAVEDSLVLSGRWETAGRVALIAGGAAIPALALAQLLEAGASAATGPASVSGVAGGTGLSDAASSAGPGMSGSSGGASSAASSGSAGGAGGGAAGGSLVTGKTLVACVTATTLATGGLTGTVQAQTSFKERSQVSGAVSAPRELSFGRVALGWNREKTITLTNVGPAPLTLSPKVASQDFSVVGGTCTTGAVRPGDPCTLRLRFQPARAGTRAASLYAGQAVVALSGKGLPTLATGQLTGTYRLAKVAYSCRIPEAPPEMCAAIKQEVQAELQREVASAPPIPIRQVVPCAGTKCAYRVDDPWWGTFTIHPYTLGGYVVLDSGLQADVQDQVDQMARNLGSNAQVQVTSVSARLVVRRGAPRIVVSAAMTALVSGRTLHSQESYTYDFTRQ